MASSSSADWIRQQFESTRTLYESIVAIEEGPEWSPQARAAEFRKFAHVALMRCFVHLLNTLSADSEDDNLPPEELKFMANIIMGFGLHLKMLDKGPGGNGVESRERGTYKRQL